jgi:uncharacterized protein (TIGR03435 family)
MGKMAHRARGFALVMMVLMAPAVRSGMAAQTQSGAAGASVPDRFEVASVRMIPEKDVVPLPGSPISPPGAGQFTMREVTLSFALAWALGVDQNRLAGGPDWLNDQYYEISAKPGGDTGLSYEQLRPMVQELLKERFHLSYHRETQDRKGYALVVAKGGSKLTASSGEGDFAYLFTDGIRVHGRSVESFAHLLQLPLGEPVVNQTGLAGSFDIDLQFAPTDGGESSLPSIFAALEEQLGLRLEKATVPVETYVIDHVDRVPTPN